MPDERRFRPGPVVRVMSINVLLVGSGGREHAIAQALSRSPLLGRLIIAPGNPGTAALGNNRDVAVDDHAGLLALAADEAIDLVVVGPEAPLVAGFGDRCRAQGLLVFGPDAAAARLEGSKRYTKDLCRAFAIPTADYAVFSDAQDAKEHVLAGRLPIVIKADGLASGKGVIIASEASEAEDAINSILGGRFGQAGAQLVIEAFLEGEEISFFALCDGERAVPFASAQDHKRVGDGDTGPNTGGMGAVSPAPLMTPALERQIMETIIEPTLRGLAAHGAPFKGVLFAGLMVGSDGPKLIEYNVRFGDPEAEVMIPRLESDLLPLLLACAEGRLAAELPRLRAEVAVGVVLAARGYPDAPENGHGDRRRRCGRACARCHRVPCRDAAGRTRAAGIGRAGCLSSRRLATPLSRPKAAPTGPWMPSTGRAAFAGATSASAGSTGNKSEVEESQDGASVQLAWMISQTSFPASSPAISTRRLVGSSSA